MIKNEKGLIIYTLMKYLKTYESDFNYNVTILTIDEFEKFYQKFIIRKKRDYDLVDKIHYFNFNDLNTWSGSKKFLESSRFIVAHNNSDILGICHFAWYSDGYAISYCSTNEDFLRKGITKKLLEYSFKYFAKTYPNDTLRFSGYSVDGWNYLRKYILEYANKYNVKIKEKWMEYAGKGHKEDDAFYDLYRKSKEEITKLYGEYY
jgi:hypothetical protein